MNGDKGQISLDFLFGIVLFLFTFTYVALFIPGLFAPFESESDMTTLQGDKTSIWLVEEKLVDDKSKPSIVNTSRLLSLLDQLNSSAANQTVVRREAGLISGIRTLDLNVSVDWLNGTVNASGNLTPSNVPVGQTKRLVKLVNTSLNESGMAGHVVIDQLFNSSAGDAVALFNPGKDPVNISGWVLGDGEQNLSFLNATFIAPRGYLTVIRGAAASFRKDCAADLEIVQTGVTNQRNVPDMVNLTGGTSGANSFALGSTDEVCLWNRNGPTGTTLVDAVRYSGGEDNTCGSVALSGSSVTWGAGSGARRINPGVEVGETGSEGSEDWAAAFGAFTPWCPTTAAIVSVRVW